MNDRTRRRVARASVVLVLIAATLIVGVSADGGAQAAAAAKITVCHRTHSTTNPYRRITVAQSAAQRHGGHEIPNGSLNPAVFDAGFTYAPNNKLWGDVIPGSTDGGGALGGSSGVALNWTDAGRGVFFGSACGAMSATQFYNTEVAAGVPPADVIADLNEQKANEDVALLAAIGGTFTSANVSTWNAAVSVTTMPATAVTSTTATFTGSLTVGTTSTVPGFEYGTSPDLTTVDSISATPSPVSGTTSVTASAGGLLPGTTYYVRITGTTNAGLETEGILRGAIVSFTTVAAETTSTVASSTTTTTTSTTEPAATTSTTEPATTTTEPATTTTTEPATTTTEPATTTTEPATTDAPVTTTAPPTTTTAAPGTTDEPLAAVTGIVWFDRNGDATLDAGEWTLPFVEVVLTSTTSSTNTSGFRTASIASATVAYAVTDADGGYRFDGIQPGQYKVTAAASIEGFDITSDTDGQTDWAVDVTAQAGQVAVADFAGLGRGTLTGSMFEVTTRNGISSAAVLCRWAGFDDVMNSADDVTFTVTAAADGTFEMRGVPYGEFSCTGTDPVTGALSAVAAASVWTPAPVHAPLPLNLGQLPTAPVVPPATPEPVMPRVPTTPPGALPVTGSSSLPGLALAAALLASGACATLLARRRRQT